MHTSYMLFLRKVKKSYNLFFKASNDKAISLIIHAFEDISSAFLCRYQCKYGYFGVPILSRLTTEFKQQLLINITMIDDVKEGKTKPKIVAYLFICEWCQCFLSSHDAGNAIQNSKDETILDILKYSLQGLYHEKLIDQDSIREIIKTSETRLRKSDPVTELV